jgi:hypothetical protein
LKELVLGFPKIAWNEIEPVIRSLTDGLVNSSVEIVTLEDWKLNRSNLQYLMENLCNMKSLKMLKIMDKLSMTDAPFYIDCTLKTTVDLFLQFEELSNNGRTVNLQDLGRKSMQFKEMYTEEEREFFSKMFEHDNNM